MPRKKPCSAKAKLDMVQRCISGEQSVEAAAQALGVRPYTVDRWIQKYRAEGPDALRHQKQNRLYSAELRQQVVAEYLSGTTSLPKLCSKYGIRSDSTVLSWVRAHQCQKETKIQTGGSRMTIAIKTPKEDQIRIAAACVANNRNYGETALRYHVSYQQVYRWVQKYHTSAE